MKKFKELSKNEKILIVMLFLSIILVIFSWQRISTRAIRVFDFYSGNRVEKTK